MAQLAGELQIDLTSDDQVRANPACRDRNRYLRTFLTSVRVGNTTLKCGDTVELVPCSGTTSGDFLRVCGFTKDVKSGKVALRGTLFRRLSHIPEIPNKYTNEVALLHHSFEGSTSTIEEQSLVVRSPEQVLLGPDSTVEIRQLIVTNAAHPAFHEASHFRSKEDRQEYRALGPLICRIVYVEEHLKTKPLRSDEQKPVSGIIHHVHQSGSGLGYGTVRKDWESMATAIRKLLGKGGITYAAGCAGTGGDVCGAKAAGLIVLWVFDKDPVALTTLQNNHPEVIVYCVDQYDALNIPIKVVILHLSWPCQAFSPARTDGRAIEDLENAHLLLATKQHLQKHQPAIMTMENTFGLHNRWKDYFNNLLSDIVSCGYNVRWKVCQFADYGLPASRQRLILIAAKCGIPLPEFPKATHGAEGSGLLPFATVYDACAFIPTSATHRDDAKIYAANDRKRPTNPNVAEKCVLTGSSTPHWSGLRSYTSRVLACLQTFDYAYKFHGTKTEVRRQIGNAVPPQPWSLFCGQIKRTLEEWRDGQIDDLGNPTEGVRTLRSDMMASFVSGSGGSSGSSSSSSSAMNTPISGFSSDGYVNVSGDEDLWMLP